MEIKKALIIDFVIITIFMLVISYILGVNFKASNIVAIVIISIIITLLSLPYFLLYYNHKKKQNKKIYYLSYIIYTIILGVILKFLFLEIIIILGLIST